MAPPVGKQTPGRYNELGNRILYLSRTAKTAAAERAPEGDKPFLYILKFSLQLPALRIVPLELDLESTHPFLHYILLDSEYAPVEGHEFSNVRNPYRATHFLAYLAHLNHVSAIEYPSVHGDIQRNSDAVNLAVLNDAVDLAQAMTEEIPFVFDRPSEGSTK